MQHRFVPAQPNDLSALQYSFSQTEAKTQYDRNRILMVTFQGVYGHGSHGSLDAHFMKAVIHFGRESFTPMGIILDFRQLDYQWGDEMGLPIDAAHVRCVRPTILISDLCREGMTSFVRAEMFSEPETWLFEDIESAVHRVEEDSKLDKRAEEYIFPTRIDKHTLEPFEDLLRNKYFRQIVAEKYRSYALPWLPFLFMRSVILADAQAFALTKGSAGVFTYLIQDFLTRFELGALDVFLEGLSYGIPPEKIYWLATLATPLLEQFIADIERRLAIDSTAGGDVLRKAYDLFSAAKHERSTRLTGEFGAH